MARGRRRDSAIMADLESAMKASDQVRWLEEDCVALCLALEGLLRFGEHRGPCEMGEHGCHAHLSAFAERQRHARETLANIAARRGSFPDTMPFPKPSEMI